MRRVWEKEYVSSSGVRSGIARGERGSVMRRRARGERLRLYAEKSNDGRLTAYSARSFTQVSELENARV